MASLALAAAALALPACSGGKDNQGAALGNYREHGPFYDNVDQAKAKAAASDLLSQLAGEDKICLVGLWAYNPPAILAAVESAKKLGKVHIVGFDEDEVTLQGVKDGHIHATVVQQPFEFGYQSVKLMAELARDPKMTIKDQLQHVPHLVIKKDNVEEFHTRLKELRKPPAAGGGREGRPRVAFVSNNEAEFWTIAEAGTRKAEKEFDVEVLFRRPKSPTAAAQKEIIQDLLSQDVKAIAISVIDPANQTEYLDQIAGKVALITVDNDAPKSKRLCYIGTDNIAAGRAVGELVKQAMPDGGHVGLFVGQPDPVNARERVQGVRDALAGKDK
jgi:ribose transport system substrate-binding protein